MVRYAGEQMYQQLNYLAGKEIFGVIIVDVKVFGAKGDGVTDDTAAIQRAINYAISIAKHEVVFPAGTYLYTTLTDTSGITFVGDGVTLNGTTPITLVSFATLQTDAAALEAGKAKKHWVDVTDNGVSNNGTDVTTLIQTLIDNNDKAIIYFPKGTYGISQPLSITNNACLLLDSGAEIKALSAMAALLTYNISYTQPIKRYVTGGKWNCNGLANIGLNLIGFAGLTVSNMLIQDPLVKGAYCGSDGIVGGGTSFELLMHDVSFVNTLSFAVNPNIIGIHNATSDCTFNSIRMKDFTKNWLVTAAGNNYIDWHGWISQSARVPTSIGVDNQAISNYYTNCYFDGFAIGFKTDHVSNLVLCIFNISSASRDPLSSNPVYINATVATAITYVDHCSFLYTGSTPGKNVDVVSGQPTAILLSNCFYSSPRTNLTSRPMIGNTRIRINAYSLAAVPANSSKTYTFTITDPDISFGMGDSVFPNTRGFYENGLIANFAVTGTNTYAMKLYNTTASPITPADRVVYATVVSNTTEIFPASMVIT